MGLVHSVKLFTNPIFHVICPLSALLPDGLCSQ